MGICFLIILSSNSLFDRNFKFDWGMLVSVLVGWGVGMLVLILLVNNTKLGDKIVKNDKKH